MCTNTKPGSGDKESHGTHPGGAQVGCGEEAWSTIAVRGAINGCDVDGFGEALNLEAGTVRACVHVHTGSRCQGRLSFGGFVWAYLYLSGLQKPHFFRTLAMIELNHHNKSHASI